MKFVSKLNEEERRNTWWTPEEERRFQVEAELEQSAQMGFAPQGAQLFGYGDDVGRFSNSTRAENIEESFPPLTLKPSCLLFTCM